MAWWRWLLRLVVAFVIAVALGYLPYRAWGPAGVGRAERLARELDDLRAGNRRLRRDSHRLRLAINRLKSDRRAIEQVARDELGLVRSSDLVFQFDTSRPVRVGPLRRRRSKARGRRNRSKSRSNRSASSSAREGRQGR